MTVGDDVALLERWRAGDDDSGQRLFARHYDDIYRFFRHKCGEAAEDLVQRTFLACIQSCERFRGDSSFRTYLFGIARNELLAYLRRQTQQGDRLDFNITSLAAIVTTLDTRIARDHAAGRLRRALTQLGVDVQLLLELSYWHDMDATALGEVFEVPPATIRTRLRRARLALRERLSTPQTCAPRPTQDQLGEWGRSSPAGSPGRRA